MSAMSRGCDLPRRVMAVSSSGGHWIELLRVAPAWAGCQVLYVTTNPLLRADLDRIDIGDGPAPRFAAVPDASQWNKLQLLRLAARVGWLVASFRPQAVVSTGSAPGYFACRFAKLFKANTVWLESIANVDELSTSGRIVEPYADLWLTQWPHQVDQIKVNGRSPRYEGKLL